MSLAILTASDDVPRSPLLVNPTAYNPFSPFQPFGNGDFGIPSFVKKSLPYSIKIIIFNFLDTKRKLKIAKMFMHWIMWQVIISRCTFMNVVVV